jgi:predicted Zn finger-like uncharacterized protein
MTITCPSCARKFSLADEALTSPFQKMKCSKCGHVFVFRKEEGERSRQEPTEEVESFTPVKAPEPEVEAEGEPRKRKGPIILVVVLVVLAGLGAGFWYYWNEYLGAGDRWLAIRNLEGQEIITKEDKVFFISGLVVNGSTKPRKYLILRARLYDKGGTVLAEKDIVAGLPLNKEGVGTMQKFDIEKKVNDFKLSARENFKVDSKAQLPFSVVFFDEGFEKAKEFTIEIIDSPLL